MICPSETGSFERKCAALWMRANRRNKRIKDYDLKYISTFEIDVSHPSIDQFDRVFTGGVGAQPDLFFLVFRFDATYIEKIDVTYIEKIDVRCIIWKIIFYVHRLLFYQMQI